MTYYSAEQPKYMKTEELEGMVRANISKDGKTLDMTGMFIEEMGAKDLAQMAFLSGIATLELGHNLIGPKGARYLAKSTVFTSLTSLNLYYNRLQDEGVKFIVLSDHLANLRNLNLSDNGVGDEGALALAKFLPLFSKLIRVDLRLNHIREEGKKALLATQQLMGLKQLLLDKDEGFMAGLKKEPPPESAAAPEEIAPEETNTASDSNPA